MKTTIQLLCLVGGACVALLHAPASAGATVQPIPLVPDVETSTLYQLFVNDREVPVGVETTGGRTFHTTAFLFAGQADVRIVVDKPISKCTIRPLRFGLGERAATEASSSQSEIRFSLSEPRRLVIEIDDLPPLVLYSSLPDKESPDADDPNVLYFGPGVHEPGRIRVKSNQTVYLAAGAKVYGTIEGTCVENVRVTGRGHLYGTKHTNWDERTYGIVFDRCRNVTVEKIGIRDCYWWTTKFLLCNGLDIRDIHILSFNRNNGGLMIDGCSNLTARDSLLMTMDDCICPHSLNAAGNGEELSDGMLFENLVLYNVFTGNAIRIGASFETQEVRNWRFRGIDVVQRHGAAIYSDHSDWALVRNLSFENFTDEVTSGHAIDMRIDKTRYSCQTGYRDERGAFDGLRFVNVRSAGGKISLRGFDEYHRIHDVVFAGCQIGNSPIDDVRDIEVNEFVTDVKVLPKEEFVSDSHQTEYDRDDPVPRFSPREITIDDGSRGFRSYGFARVTTAADSHGGDASIGKVADAFGQYAAAIYEPRISGRYEIHAYIGDWRGMDERAPWIVKHRDGYSRAYVNQRENPGWHSLGTFGLDADSDVRLVYPNYFEPTRNPVVADAVRFVRVDGE